MRFVVSAIAILGVLAASAVAQNAIDFDTMTCADLLALDDAERSDAIKELRDWVTFSAESPDPAADSGTATTDTTGGNTAGSETAAAETGAAETGAGTGAAGDDTAASETAGAAADVDAAEASTETADAAEGDAGSTEPEIAATQAACEAVPDTLAKDAMAAALEEVL